MKPSFWASFNVYFLGKKNLLNFDHFFDHISYQNPWGLPYGPYGGQLWPPPMSLVRNLVKKMIKIYQFFFQKKDIKKRSETWFHKNRTKTRDFNLFTARHEKSTSSESGHSSNLLCSTFLSKHLYRHSDIFAFAWRAWVCRGLKTFYWSF